MPTVWRHLLKNVEISRLRSKTCPLRRMTNKKNIPITKNIYAPFMYLKTFKSLYLLSLSMHGFHFSKFDINQQGKSPFDKVNQLYAVDGLHALVKTYFPGGTNEM